MEGYRAIVRRPEDEDGISLGSTALLLGARFKTIHRIVDEHGIDSSSWTALIDVNGDELWRMLYFDREQAQRIADLYAKRRHRRRTVLPQPFPHSGTVSVTWEPITSQVQQSAANTLDPTAYHES